MSARARALAASGHARSAGLVLAQPKEAVTVTAAQTGVAADAAPRATALRMIDAVPLFASLTEEEKQALAPTMTRRTYGKGETLAEQGAKDPRDRCAADKNENSPDNPPVMPIEWVCSWERTDSPSAHRCREPPSRRSRDCRSTAGRARQCMDEAVPNGCRNSV